MIAESAPFGGIVDVEAGDNTHNEAGYIGSTWNRWFEPVLSFIERYEVKMWCYINCDWDALPMFRLKSSSDALTSTSISAATPTIENTHDRDIIAALLTESSRKGSDGGSDASTGSSSNIDDENGGSISAKDRERRQVEVPVEQWGDSRVQGE